MIGMIVNAITGPMFDRALDAWKAKLASDSEGDKLAADLAARELAVEQKARELQSQERVAIIGRPSDPANIIGWTLAAHIILVVVTNALYGFGLTSWSIPEIKGDVGEWLGMAANLFIAGRMSLGIAETFRRR